MSFFSKPIVKTVLVIVAVIVVLKFANPYTAKIPVIGQYLQLN